MKRFIFLVSMFGLMQQDQVSAAPAGVATAFEVDEQNLENLYLTPAQISNIQSYCAQLKYTYQQKVYYIVETATANINLAQQAYNDIINPSQDPLIEATNFIQNANSTFEKINTATATDDQMYKSLHLTLEQTTDIQNYCNQQKYTYPQKVYYIIKTVMGNTTLAQTAYNSVVNSSKDPITKAYNVIQNAYQLLESVHVATATDAQMQAVLGLTAAQITDIENYCNKAEHTYAQKVYHIIKVATGNILLAQAKYESIINPVYANPLTKAYSIIQNADQILAKIDTATATDAQILANLNLTPAQITNIANYCAQSKYTYQQKVYYILKVATGNINLAQSTYESLAKNTKEQPQVSPVSYAYSILQSAIPQALNQNQITGSITDAQMQAALGLTPAQITDIQNYCNQVAFSTTGLNVGQAVGLGVTIVGVAPAIVMESKAKNHAQLKYSYAQKVYYIIKIATGDLVLAQAAYDSILNAEPLNADPLKDAFKVIQNESHIVQLSRILTNDDVTNLKRFIKKYPTFDWTLNYNNFIWLNLSETAINAATWLGAANCVQYLLKNNVGDIQKSINIVASNFRSPLFRTMFPPAVNTSLYPNQNAQNWASIATMLNQYGALNLY